ncbi:MAG: SDR family oxidoreductase [Planctomycetota bacterium]|nr:SDR family oxidoreductase [Planctomycetota bacterium]
MDDSPSRVALITGGASGLGRSTAEALARRGWSIFLQHNSPADAAEQAVAAIHQAANKAEQNIEVASGKADLTVSEQREQLVEQVLDDFERIDMLVNASATPGTADDLLEITEDAYEHLIRANVTATLFLTQLVANEMVRLVEAALVENPKIVTINSISAYTTSADHGPHCISRAALGMLTRLFADRLGEHGINVYEVRAGIIATDVADSAHARYDELIAEGLTPIRRWGRAGDVARAVVAIAEDLLTFSTGEVINVDGGFHLRRL